MKGSARHQVNHNTCHFRLAQTTFACQDEDPTFVLPCIDPTLHTRRNQETGYWVVGVLHEGAKVNELKPQTPSHFAKQGTRVLRRSKIVPQQDIANLFGVANYSSQLRFCLHGLRNNNVSELGECQKWPSATSDLAGQGQPGTTHASWN